MEEEGTKQDGKLDQEMKRRIGIAKEDGTGLESKSVTIATRLQLLKCYV